MKFNFNRYIFLTTSIVVLLLTACKKEQKRKRPNIVLIMADDMGFSDIGCYGSQIETPNIDALAENGVRFTHFYNGARCCPTRASILTGLYAHQTGLGHMTGTVTEHPGYKGELNKHCVTIAQVLKNSGYHTYMAGKWHVARSEDTSDMHNWPLQRGFDRFFGTIKGGGNYFDPNGLLMGNRFVETDKDFYYTDAISRQAAGYLRQYASIKDDHPFFMYVAFTAPHWPLHAPDSSIEKYQGRFDAGWDQLRKRRLSRLREMGIIDAGWKLSGRDPRIPAWKEAKNKNWHKRRMEVYAAQIDQMDQGIGRIVNTLEEGDELDNTLIFFLSDNGGCAEELTPGWKGFLKRLVGDTLTREGEPIRFCNTPEIMPGSESTYQSVGLNWANLQNTPFRMYKQYGHEGGIATPLIMHWPDGIKARGELRHTPGHIIDIMATCVDVAGGRYPKRYEGSEIHPMEGASLMPCVREEASLKDRVLCWEHQWNRAILDYPWKLVAKGKEGAWELYNLNEDRTEIHDLAEDYPEKVSRMADKWHQWAERTNVLPHY